MAENANIRTGNLGENIAAEFLLSRGCRILERNYRSRGGEVDIVAMAIDGTILFVEVKSRRNLSFGVPQQSVTSRKQRQISKGALSWLAMHRMHNSPARFDVIAILLPDAGSPSVEYIENAFELNY